MSDYKKYATDIWSALQKGKLASHNMRFLQDLLRELLQNSRSTEIQEMSNFLQQILTSRKKEEKDSRKKTKQSLNVGSGKAPAAPTTSASTHYYEYSDEDDYYDEDDEYAQYYDDY